MSLGVYVRVVYIGPEGICKNVYVGRYGYVIENYQDGNYEVEFSNSKGISDAQIVVPGEWLKTEPEIIAG